METTVGLPRRNTLSVFSIFLVYLAGYDSRPLVPSGGRLSLPTRRVGTTVKKINVEI